MYDMRCKLATFPSTFYRFKVKLERKKERKGTCADFLTIDILIG